MLGRPAADVTIVLGRPEAEGTIGRGRPGEEGTDDGPARPTRGPAAMGRVRSRNCGTGPVPLLRGRYGRGQLSGCASRWAMWSGRGAEAAKGSCRAFSTLLNTRKMFERGNGVMLLPEPCMMFESNHRAEPAGPVN